jgi:hypothetical protein
LSAYLLKVHWIFIFLTVIWLNLRLYHLFGINLLSSFLITLSFRGWTRWRKWSCFITVMMTGRNLWRGFSFLKACRVSWWISAVCASLLADLKLSILRMILVKRIRGWLLRSLVNSTNRIQVISRLLWYHCRKGVQMG